MFRKTQILNLSVLAGLAVIGSGGASALAFTNLPYLHPVTPSVLTLQVADQAIVDGSRNFIESMSERGIGFLADDTMSDETRKAEFKKLLEDSFDMKTIARFALGRYWRTATDAQKTEYLKLFQDMVVSVYSRRFGEYKGQGFEVVDAKPEGQSDAVVTSRIVSDNGPSVRIDWRVRYKKGKYKVIDIVVEGVSMGLTQRSDFSSVIQRGGGKIEALLDHLRQS